MTPEQEYQLTGGGEINLHSHPHTVTIDQLHRMQELERVVTVTSNYSVGRNDDIIFVNTTSGAVTVTLPLANAGQHVIISRVSGANNVTVSAQSGETVNGAASQTISSSYTPLRLKAIKGVGYYGI